MSEKNYFIKSSNVIKSLDNHLQLINKIAKEIYKSQKQGGKLLIAGNGGSSADAEHFAGEMTCTYKNPKRKSFNAISLSSNSAAVTAWANDFGFDTLTVNGCFESTKDGFIKSTKSFALGSLNSMGLKLNLSLLFNFKLILFFFNLLRKVVKKI